MARILYRIEHGVHENTPLIYQPVLGLIEVARRRAEQARGMRLKKLNDTRMIGRKMMVIDDYKELTMAIASGKMARVGNLLESGLANHAGVRGLVGLCLRAQVGKARAVHDAASRAVGLLLLRLGGRVLQKLATVHWVSRVLPHSGAIRSFALFYHRPGSLWLPILKPILILALMPLSNFPSTNHRPRRRRLCTTC